MINSWTLPVVFCKFFTKDLPLMESAMRYVELWQNRDLFSGGGGRHRGSHGLEERHGITGSSLVASSLQGERAGHRRLALLLLFLGASLFGGLSLYACCTLGSLGGVSLWAVWVSRCKRLCASNAVELVKPASHWGIEQMYGRKWTWVCRCWNKNH